MAVTTAGLPPQTAIDLVINQAPTLGVEWYGHTPFGLGLESSRVSPFLNYPAGVSREDAFALLAKTAVDMLYSLAQKGTLASGSLNDYMVGLMGLGLQFDGGNDIKIETQGGFNFYFNNKTGTKAMIDQSGNGQIIYNGQEMQVSPSNFRKNGNGGYDIRLQNGSWVGAGLDDSILSGSFAAVEQPDNDIAVKAVSGGQLLASLVDDAIGEMSYTQTVYKSTSNSSGVASIVTARGGAESTLVFDGNASAAPAGTTVGSNQFYVDQNYNTFDSIAAATGVSVSTLLGLNGSLGLTSGDQTISTGQLINLPGATNLIDITTTPDPQPQTQIQNENQLSQNASNGYVAVNPTSSISFSNNTLNNTDFASSQMGSLASGGVRPGEVQLDPNARPNSYLSQFYIDPATSAQANAGLVNAVTLNGLAAMTTVNTYVDPVLLDLTGTGVHMTSISDGVLFDTDHSGTLKRTGWADSKTGMLVVDDGSGQIKDVSQMFSEYYGGNAGTNGGPGQAPFKDGFAALASEDKNGDGVIDKNDPIWSKLRVWVDANHDGKTDAGELKTLDELGITQINVKATASPTGETRDGNEVLSHGSFTINGKTQEALAVDFLGDPVSSTFAAQGSGTVVTSSTGKSTTTAYTSTSTADETLDAGKLGVNNVYAGSGNDTLVAAASGSWLVGGGGSNTYVGGAGDDVFVISAKDNPQNVHGNGGRDTAIIVGDQGVTLNMAQAGLTIAEGGRGDDVIMSGGRTSAFIKGGTGNDTLIGGAGNDVIVGGSGHNTIIGGTGKAVIYAGPNGDTIYAAAGDSIINAGGGDDHIYGGAGNDVITVGRGNAVIDGGGGTNVVTFHGSYGDYRIVKADDGYWVADKIPNRDGTVFLKNVQKLNFADISAVDLTLPNPMPVADSLTADSSGNTFDRTQSHLIAANQLLANDQRLNSQGPLHISAVGDAIGGTVTLTQAGDVLFTPDATFTGIMSFKYSVADAAGHTSATVQSLANGATAPMRATATLLTPEVPTDPLVSQEWYLSDTNVLPVWKDYTGKGVHIGQFEPGGKFAVGPEIFDYNHADLAPNVDPAWLATQKANGTLPTATSNHATMVAGVMVAAKNGSGGVGVAYDATLAGYYLANNGSDLSGLGHMVSYDVANNSWDFETDFALSNLQSGGSINTASMLTSNAQYAADNGRGGLGTVIVAAGGNARATGGNAEGSLTNNNRFSIEVGAINAQGDLSTLQIGSAPFSNPGASLLVSAPGSNVVSTSQMVVTDQGSTFGSNYSDMQGTSFATPIVSGVVALMLEANPNLGYRDVQEILALSARKVNDPNTQWSDNGATNWNGGGLHASNDYGFGEVDARAAVRLAETWMTQNTGANEMVFSASSGSVAQTASAGQTIASTLAMNGGLNVEHAEIDFDANVGRLGDLIVTLVAPDGTQSILLNREGKIPDGTSGASASDVGSTQSGDFKYTFMSTHDWGETSGGNWTLQVTDAATGQPVTLNNWSLRLYGSKASADNTYFYTDEYKSAVLANAKRGVLDDAVDGTAGGRNTIDAAAVSGDTTVNLLTGVASLGGTALTINNPGTIQNIVTGDGNDTLVANNADAMLDGGRGQNHLVGGTGKDLFVVHRRDSGLDTIDNFDASRGETIDLVGFKGKGFGDLALMQQGTDVKVDLGNGQSIVLTNQTLANVGAGQFTFQDTFVAPSAYVSSGGTSTTPPSGTGTVTLSGGATGVSYTTVNGQLTASLAGTVYSHDTATSDLFVIAKQSGVSSFHNALRGFKHGIDKIDLSQLGITSFSDLVVTQTNRATINGVAQIHGVSISSTSLGTSGSTVELAYLDALDPSQISASDFVFAPSTPGQAGVVTAPVASTPDSPPAQVTIPASTGTDPSIIGSNSGITTSRDANGVVTVQSSVDYALSDNVNRLTLTGTGDIIATANNNGDVLTGNAGNDVLLGGDGNDTLVAGTGNDLMIGGAGTNTYVVSTGGGTDTVQANAGQQDSLVLEGAAANAVRLAAQGNDLSITLDAGQSNGSRVLVSNQFGGKGVGAITIGSQTLSASDIAAIVNQGAVTASTSAVDQSLLTNTAWWYTLPATLFSATVAGDALTYSASLANGDPLPAWLHFDPSTQVLTGKADAANIGDLAVKVTATDMAGQSASSTVTLHVAQNPTAPTLGASLAPQTVAAGSAWTYALPAGLFSPANAGDTLVYTATLSNGDPLPAWLSFDPAKQTFSGLPTDQTTGALSVTITATEGLGIATSTTLNLQVDPTYQAPTVTQTLDKQAVSAGTPWTFSLPAGLFAPAVAGDSLHYAATLADGSALPVWLTFDPQKLSFSGAPTDLTTGALSIAITATDMGGLATRTTLDVQVDPAYQAPTVTQTLAAQQIAAGSMWSYALPASLFSEPIAGDSLAYSATLADGSPLPSWLTFDPAKGTFSGQATNALAGTLDVRVTATDLGGLATSTSLSLQVVPTYQAATVTQPLPSQALSAGSTWSYTLPVSLFSEAVAGDTLTYSATLANGSPLPAWLTFDPVKQTFSGTPTDQQTGNVQVKVTATDMGGLATSTALNLQIVPVYQAPIVGQTLSPQTAAAGTAWTYTLPPALFSEAVAGDTLSYGATLANGSPLPAWLTFDPVKQTFSGTPTDLTTGALAVTVTATDRGGLSASSTLNLQVNPTYSAPTVTQTLSNQTAKNGTSWTYALPSTLFSESIAGDTLTYAATLADGSALPSWLSFDAQKQAFTGTPPAEASGTLVINITATDMGGLSASTTLSVTPNGAYQAPTVTQALSSQTLPAGTTWTYALPATLFSEPVAGDTLTYTATLGDGTPLPSWLSFDPVKQTLSGVPTDQTTGPMTVKITATDQSGLSASTTLGLQVNPTYRAPMPGQTAYQMASLGKAWTYALPSTLFYASVPGDTLAYSATMPDGSPLPSWLSFDPIKQTFSGTPPGQSATSMDIKVTATDMGGLSASTTLNLQLQPNVLDVSTTFQTVTIAAGQTAISESGSFDKVTANDEDHVVLVTGAFSSATLGNGGNEAILTASFNALSVGNGDNSITLAGSSETLTAGTGKNTVLVSGGSDTVTVGDGDNSITLAGSSDTLTAGTGKNTVVASGGSDTVTVGDGDNSITLGSSDTLTAGNGNNTVVASGTFDTVKLGNGNNTVAASGTFDTVKAGNGNNTVVASGTFDTVTVGTGTNAITATGTFATLNLGDGTDTATLKNTFATVNVGHGTYNLEFTSGFGSKLAFGSDVASDHLWFEHVGQDLRIDVIGSSEQITLKNWYASSPEHVGQISSGDGKALSDFNVEKLVQAMASFAPPAAGQTAMSADEQKALQPVLAANWR
ncbi:MAG: putative Ig domain-containing protein [Trinickia sp.]